MASRLVFRAQARDPQRRLDSNGNSPDTGDKYPGFIADQHHPYNETDRVRKILDEIRELSTEEVNALILAGKDTVFRNLYADARFGHRLSIALTQR